MLLLEIVNAFIGIGKKYVGVMISMRYHEVLIAFMRAARVPPPGVDFANILKEVTLLDETSESVYDTLCMIHCLTYACTYIYIYIYTVFSIISILVKLYDMSLTIIFTPSTREIQRRHPVDATNRSCCVQ